MSEEPNPFRRSRELIRKPAPPLPEHDLPEGVEARGFTSAPLERSTVFWDLERRRRERDAQARAQARLHQEIMGQIHRGIRDRLQRETPEIVRFPARKDNGEFVGFYEMMPSTWHYVAPGSNDPAPFRPRTAVVHDPKIAELFSGVAKSINENLAPVLRSIFESFEGLSRSIDQVVRDNPELFAPEHHHVHPNAFRDARGVKRPSPVVPFWAVQPNKKRNR